jgi:hypothetical protein
MVKPRDARVDISGWFPRGFCASSLAHLVRDRRRPWTVLHDRLQ